MAAASAARDNHEASRHMSFEALEVGMAVPVETRELGRYTLLVKLAARGVADVFLGKLRTIEGFHKLVVLKVLRAGHASDARVVQAFVREARLVAPLTHANVCEVRELGNADGTYFIVLEHLLGVPLATLLRRIERTDDGRDLRLATGLI